MELDLYSEPKHKVGDLVKITERIDFLLYGHCVEPGAIGIVVFVDMPNLEEYTIWGVDYGVLVDGDVLVCFETELEEVDVEQLLKDIKCSSKD